MRLISLDFDGVLHPSSAILGLSVGSDLEAAALERDLFRWRSALVDLLASPQHADVTLAVHSSWRQYVDNSTLLRLLGSELAPRFIGITPRELRRQASIEELAERAGVEHLLVIDDDRDSFDEGYEALLLTDPDTGLSDAAIQRKIAAWLVETAA